LSTIPLTELSLFRSGSIGTSASNSCDEVVVSGNVFIFRPKAFDKIELSNDSVIDSTGISEVLVIGVDYDCSTK
jgi:hypothetical protein